MLKKGLILYLRKKGKRNSDTMDLKKFDGKNVKVIGTDGKTYSGFVELYTQPNDNDGVEAIALSCGAWLDATDIKTIEAID